MHDSFFHSLMDLQGNVVFSRIEGSLRIDISNKGVTEHWFVDLGPEGIRVSQSSRPANAVMTAGPELLGRLISGETTVTAAILRNEATYAGDVRLVLVFQRLLGQGREVDVRHDEASPEQRR